MRKHFVHFPVDFFLQFRGSGIFDEWDVVARQEESSHAPTHEVLTIVKAVWMVVYDDIMGWVVVFKPKERENIARCFHRRWSQHISQQVMLTQPVMGRSVMPAVPPFGNSAYSLLTLESLKVQLPYQTYCTGQPGEATPPPANDVWSWKHSSLLQIGSNRPWLARDISYTKRTHTHTHM